MAVYSIINPIAASYIDVFTDTIDGTPSAAEVRVVNADGTITVIAGLDLTLSGGVATAGTITSITRQSADGLTIFETITGLVAANNSFVSFWNAATPEDRFAYMSSQADTLNGSTGADLLNGGTGSDTLIGDGDNDIIDGGGGSDTVSGGAGDDQLYVGAAAAGDFDAIDGGDDRDSISIAPSFADPIWIDLQYSSSEVWALIGGTWTAIADLSSIEDMSSGNQTSYLFGDDNENYIVGGGADDQLYGRGGNDNIFGGFGNDYIEGGEGSDVIHGEVGSDIIFGNGGIDYIYLPDNTSNNGYGVDVIDGGEGSDVLYLFSMDSLAWVDLEYGGSEAWTQITGVGWKPIADLTSVETIVGTGFNDYIAGDAAANFLNGAGGNDVLDGRGGADFLVGDTGNDQLFGGADDDVFIFSESGYLNLDTADGGTGSDTLDFSLTGNSVWVDLDYAGIEAWMHDGGSWQVVADLTGMENMTGGSGKDYLYGNADDNVITGGLGDDLLTGRAGADTFVYDQLGFGQDTITDFEDGSDLLRFAAGVADDISDFIITGGGTTTVTLQLRDYPSTQIKLEGSAPITLTNADFDFI